jgi:Tfp pilus assembly protein PilF
MLRIGAKLRVGALALIITVLCGIASSKTTTPDEQLCDATADFALGREDYPTAILLHRKLLQSQPENALAHYHLGFAYGMLGRAAEELSEYQTATRLGLKSWDLFLNLGLAYLERHELALATEALKAAVSLGPKHAEAHFNLAIAYECENRLGDALREVTAARRLAPDDPEASNENAVICARMGDLGGAHDVWTRLLRAAPDYAPARANLAMLRWFTCATGRLAAHTGICP